MRRIFAANNTFLKGRFIQQLLLVIGIDANGNALILAWAIVESKNEDSWQYFFTNLIRAILEIKEEATIFISDCDKGLAAIKGKLGKGIIKAVCAYYLIDNFIVKYSYTLKPLF
jgi:hypothetical protein